jgi:hypothetical protein
MPIEGCRKMDKKNLSDDGYTNGDRRCYNIKTVDTSMSDASLTGVNSDG